MRKLSELLLEKGHQFNRTDINDTVREALAKMASENLSYVIVFDNGVYVGVFCERDYARKGILMNRHSDTTLVREMMTDDLPVVNGDYEAEECMVLMNAHKTRYVAVFDGLVFKGIITIHDLMRETIRSLEEHSHTDVGKRKLQTAKEHFHYWV
jgi:predicted transcriptional regulator